jgi:hypothetical protein
MRRFRCISVCLPVSGANKAQDLMLTRRARGPRSATRCRCCWP